MIAENLLTDIGFSDEIQGKIYSLYKNSSDILSPISADYMAEKLSVAEVDEKLKALETPDSPLYTLYLLFILDCTSFLKEKYRLSGIGYDIFINTLFDIKYKVQECLDLYGVLGIFAFGWYDGFFKLERFAAGRLQYDLRPFDGNPLEVAGHTVEPGDPVLWCHIPSGSSLNHEDCIESYKMAYTLFPERVKNGILPVFCGSWLLYPDYAEVFGANSNIIKFAKDFHIFFVQIQETFRDGWRVFNTLCYDNPDLLIQSTSMQKNFVRYIKENRPFGSGTGILLFDGEKVITQNDKI